MDVIKLPKKFRETCYAIMDGHDEMLETLESFSKYPHQITAVKAEVAYYNMDYENALKCDLEILPFFDEWYYSNVADEHMAAMSYAAIKLQREKQVIEAFTREQERIRSEGRSEGGGRSRSNYCEIMKSYLQKGVLPFSDRDEMHYHDPSDGKATEELCQELKTTAKKIDFDSVDGLTKLFHACCRSGFAKEAIKVYEQISNEHLSELVYENAIVRYLYLGEKEKAIQTMERMATARLWSVAAPTQVRPMRFFKLPFLHDFLDDEEVLKRIRDAAYIDNGTVIRK